ncbi:MAG: ABC transporter ATP-binding protein [Dehalococcoidia bacterium]
MSRSPLMIRIAGLIHRYGKREVLKGLDLSIVRGETFALIGPTGAGKTTLLRLIDLLETPCSGELYFDDRPVPGSGKQRLEMRRRMSLIHQKPQFFSSSVYDNVACGLKWRGKKETETVKKVRSILETVGLDGYEDRDARTLSGGEAQRVALARALVLEPEVLLLDEPTANLDPVSAAKIERLIQSIAGQRSMTMIMATHDMSQGQYLANRIGVLIDGRLVQTGNAVEVFRSPRSEEVAGFVGMENIIEGTVVANSEGIATVNIGRDCDGMTIQAITGQPVGREVCACVRPEDITLAAVTHRSSARNSFRGTVTGVVSSGPLSRVEVDCGFALVALVTRLSAEELGLKEGSVVVADFKATAVHVIERSSGR